MESVKIQSTVHYLEKLRWIKAEDGKPRLSSVNEIPCHPEEDEIIKTGTTFAAVNCPKCLKWLKNRCKP